MIDTSKLRADYAEYIQSQEDKYYASLNALEDALKDFPPEFQPKSLEQCGAWPRANWSLDVFCISKDGGVYLVCTKRGYQMKSFNNSLELLEVVKDALAYVPPKRFCESCDQPVPEFNF